MKTIYGLKMLEAEDILEFTGAPMNALNLVKFELNKGLDPENFYARKTIDFREEATLISNMIDVSKVIFIPMSILYANFGKAACSELQENFSKYMPLQIIKKTEWSLEDIHEKLDDLVDEESGYTAGHAMFVYSNKGLIRDIRTVIPSTWAEFISSMEVKYICHNCKSIKRFKVMGVESKILPDLKYSTLNEEKEIRYYCPECQGEKTKDFPFVGDREKNTLV